ncbi:hypothetical protein HJD18_05505 [Thermoleophilia bacterium SCSIO 60948]|nr:hypothetical protein HJD18_05505 [Thermoleophilia bacterium SCSIO 60948]
MQSLKTRAGAAALAALTAAAIAVAPADAGTAAGGKLTIQVNEAGSKIGGKMTSNKASCERNRRVKLFFGEMGAFRPVAMDQTNEDGRWSIGGPDGSIPSGRYYAKATRKDGCKVVKSERISYEGGPVR